MAGKFVWHDLMTTDRDAAVEFYTKLFGWQVVDQEIEGLGTYKMILNGEEMEGGMVPIEDDRTPSHWISYLEVGDVDAACEKIQALGGKVYAPPVDIADIGRFAPVADPQGAHFHAYKHFGEGQTKAETPPAGRIVWNELLTSDPDAAAKFYGEIAGWTETTMDMGDKGTYHMLREGDQDRAGMIQKPGPEEAPPCWMLYVNVDDVDRSAARIKELGGCLYVEPRDIPGVGRFCVGADPTGAMFALWKRA